MVKEIKYELRLYIAGQTPKSVTALNNITRYCEEHLKSTYKIEVIDSLRHHNWQKVTRYLPYLPCLVRKVPESIPKIIGDLSNEEKVLVGLN